MCEISANLEFQEVETFSSNHSRSNSQSDTAINRFAGDKSIYLYIYAALPPNGGLGAGVSLSEGCRVGGWAGEAGATCDSRGCVLAVNGSGYSVSLRPAPLISPLAATVSDRRRSSASFFLLSVCHSASQALAW